MADAIQVVCPGCSAANRVPPARLAEAPTCGKCKKALFVGHSLTLTTANFDRQINASDLPVVVDFWATWCGPCRAMASDFERAGVLLAPHVRFAKLDTESEFQIAARFGIRAVPTLIVFRKGRAIARQSGAMELARLLAWVKEVAWVKDAACVKEAAWAKEAVFEERPQRESST